MSATLPNLGDLSCWLRASLYTTNFRPVPLTELLKVGDTLLSTCMKPVGSVSPPLPIPGDPDHLTWLCLQTVLEGHSVLLFCSTKSWVEKLAEAVSQALLSLGRPDPRDSDPVSCEIRSKLQGQLSGTRLEEVSLWNNFHVHWKCPGAPATAELSCGARCHPGKGTEGRGGLSPRRAHH